MIAVKRPVIMLAALAMAVVALAMLTNVVPFRQVMAQRAQIDVASQELAGLVAENAMLTQQVTALETPVEIERIAREKLGYVRPGETAFVVVEPEASAVSGIGAEEAVIVLDEPSFVDRIWAYLTGADLVAG